MIRIILKNKIKLFTKNIPMLIIKKIKKDLTVIHDMNGIIIYYQENKKTINIPRGYLPNLEHLLNKNNIIYKIIDNTFLSEETNFTFNGKLLEHQKLPVKTILKNEIGILQSPTGSGKTIMALNIVTERKQKTLIIVHREELLYQWKDRISQFLNIPLKDIGLIGDGNSCNIINKNITVGIINSLYKYYEEINKNIGFIIIDEVHRLPSKYFSKTIGNLFSYYILGLSATPKRRDGLTKVINFYCGPIIYKIKPKELQIENRMMVPILIKRNTDFNFYYNDSYNTYSKMIKMIISSDKRNRLICKDISNHIKNNPGIGLVVTDRKNHCQILYNYLAMDHNVLLLTSDVKSWNRKLIVEQLNKEKTKVQILIATTPLIVEGFDCKNLTSLFLTNPISKKGTRLEQIVGRIVRKAKWKKECYIYDYVDKPGILQGMYKGRLNIYKNQLGIIDIREI